jgi:hypothetical protein
MDKGNARLSAAVLQHCFLIPQRDLKLALGLIVRNGIAIHKTACSVCCRFYANAAHQ